MTMPRVRRQTSFRLMAAVLLPCSAITFGLLAGIAEGAIPISLAVSSGGFKISADAFDAQHVQQFGSTVREKDGHLDPVALTAIKSATLSNLCQSVAIKLPLIDKFVALRITGGDQGTPVSASNMIIAATAQRGDAEFKNIEIGVDASTVSQYPSLVGSAGAFALQADSLHINHLQEDQFSVTAGTFTVPHLNLSLTRGNAECY